MAAAALAVCLSLSEFRFLVRVWLGVAFTALGALPALLRDDGAATARLAAIASLRMVLAMIPLAVFVRSLAWRHRFLLAPVVAVFVIVGTSLSLAAGRDITFAVLIPVVLAALLLQRVRWLRWTAFVPLLLFFSVQYRHNIVAILEIGPAGRERRLAICQQRDGEVPVGLTAKMVRPYYGVTPFDDDLVLLTGVGENDGGAHFADSPGAPLFKSWWMRRRADGRFAVAEESNATGNLWRGCRLGDTLWMTRPNYLVGARRLPEGSEVQEQILFYRLPSKDTDFGESACDTVRGRVYAAEASLGGIWEVDPARVAAAQAAGEDISAAMRRHEIGGYGLMMTQYPNGLLVMRSTAEGILFDPATESVVERFPAALAGFGISTCFVDRSLAFSDASGRVRVYARGADGHYHFSWGVSVFAPRRVAFSPDCSRLAVTSFDDYSVHIIDTATHRVIETHLAGPSLREVTATGPREFSIADICSMTTYRW